MLEKHFKILETCIRLLLVAKCCNTYSLKKHHLPFAKQPSSLAAFAPTPRHLKRLGRKRQAAAECGIVGLENSRKGVWLANFWLAKGLVVKVCLVSGLWPCQGPDSAGSSKVLCFLLTV